MVEAHNFSTQWDWGTNIKSLSSTWGILPGSEGGKRQKGETDWEEETETDRDRLKQKQREKDRDRETETGTSWDREWPRDRETETEEILPTDTDRSYNLRSRSYNTEFWDDLALIDIAQEYAFTNNRQLTQAVI